MEAKQKELGHVIRILDKYTILVDVGKGVLSVKDKIHVYTPGEEIIGMDGKVIDRFACIKDELNVIQVENNYSICKKEKTVPSAMASLSISPLFDTLKVDRPPLPVNDAEIQPLPSFDHKIHVGDFIKLA